MQLKKFYTTNTFMTIAGSVRSVRCKICKGEATTPISTPSVATFREHLEAAHPYLKLIIK